jgi:aspartate/methionine/tyrosine aminotransferase
MNSIISSKPKLPDGWLDVSVGEPHIVRQKLMEVFDLSLYEVPQKEHFHEYPPPAGYGPLVKLLEEKHHAPIVITNGAKGALGAVFYALTQMNRWNLGMQTPYWALIPPLMKMHGLSSLPPPPLDDEISGMDCYLSLAPNNPDGHMPDLKSDSEAMKAQGIPFIHDAAYYTHTYLPSSTQLGQYGDVQIYSISKMLGLSGLRIGYAVCPNPEFYKLILQYMEAMTVGVSIVSQVFLFDLLDRMRSYPTLTERFEWLSSNALLEAKKIISQVDPEVLVVPKNIESIPGMFGWFKVGPKANFEKAKINLIDGSLFGSPGMIRMNLAFDTSTLNSIVERLNSSKAI